MHWKRYLKGFIKTCSSSLTKSDISIFFLSQLVILNIYKIQITWLRWFTDNLVHNCLYTLFYCCFLTKPLFLSDCPSFQTEATVTTDGRYWPMSRSRRTLLDSYEDDFPMAELWHHISWCGGPLIYCCCMLWPGFKSAFMFCSPGQFRGDTRHYCWQSTNVQKRRDSKCEKWSILRDFTVLVSTNWNTLPIRFQMHTHRNLWERASLLKTNIWITECKDQVSTPKTTAHYKTKSCWQDGRNKRFLLLFNVSDDISS